MDWEGLRRHMLAVLIDGASVFLIAWIVTRFIGGRELETLLRFPSTVRLDAGLLQSLKDLLPAIIASALTAVLTGVAVGAAYMLGSALTPLRGTPGERVMGVQVTDVSGAPVTIAALGARYAVNVMLFVAPGILGLLPTLVSLSGPAASLRSPLTLFGFSIWVGVVLLLLGQLPVFGGRGQTLAEYLSDCKINSAPKLETKLPRPVKAQGEGRAARDSQV
jgi:RDD family